MKTRVATDRDPRRTENLTLKVLIEYYAYKLRTSSLLAELMPVNSAVKWKRIDKSLSIDLSLKQNPRAFNCTMTVAKLNQRRTLAAIS